MSAEAIIAKLLEGDELDFDQDSPKELAPITYEYVIKWLQDNGFSHDRVSGNYVKYFDKGDHTEAISVQAIMSRGYYDISYWEKSHMVWNGKRGGEKLTGAELIDELTPRLSEGMEDDDFEDAKDLMRDQNSQLYELRKMFAFGKKAEIVNLGASEITILFVGGEIWHALLPNSEIEFMLNNWGSLKGVPISGSLGEAFEDDFEDDIIRDVTRPGDYQQLVNLIGDGILTVSGMVGRGDRHYVHENTTEVTLRDDWDWPGGTPEEMQQQVVVQDQVGELLDRLQEEITSHMRSWNKKIYRELESAYDGETSDEAVAETILANEYGFDEDGDRTEAGGALTYDQLNPEAQEKARLWWVQSMGEAGDTFYAEPVIAEWRWLLANKGFTDVEIAWSGFWNQGDGASFTADHIDIVKYLQGPDPLTFPEAERGQLDEALGASGAEDFEPDPKDVYQPPPRRAIKDIKTKKDYEEYQERVREFFVREGIVNLSPIGDAQGDSMEFFSWIPCEVCRRPLGGNREECSGYNPSTKEILNFTACSDCIYYAEYGQLPDQTMMDLKDDPPEDIHERHGGATQERGIWYHGTSAALIPKILSQGLIVNPKKRAWHEDPHTSIVQASRKSLENSIYVTTNLGTSTLSAQKVAQRDKTNQAIIVMELQPRSMVADEDDVTHNIKSIAPHLMDSAYHHIWHYFMEVYGKQLSSQGADDYRKDALTQKQKWVDDVTKSLLYGFGEGKAHPELEKQVKALLFNEGFRAMLQRMVSYIKGNWDLGHWRKFWSEGFGAYDDAPEIPNSAEAEKAWLAFADKLSRTLKDKARPAKAAEQWRFRDTGRLLQNVGYQGSNRIICVIERVDAKAPEYHSTMIVHYGKPPQKLIDDWKASINGLERPGDIVYKNQPQVSEALEDDDFDLKDILGEPPAPKYFTVTSSWGEFVARVDDGQIIEKRLQSPNLDDEDEVRDFREILDKIQRFDVNEWRKQYPTESLDNAHVDILDLGYWLEDQTYEPPADDWRIEFRQPPH